jgi:hypothetical protein
LGINEIIIIYRIQHNPFELISHIPSPDNLKSSAPEGGKQPRFISAADGAVLSIAGLWDQWKDPETGESVLSCTLIVTAANEFTRLTGKAGVELLRPAPNAHVAGLEAG